MIWQWIRFPLLFLVAVVMQTTVSKWIRIFDIGPDFIIIFIVLIALRRGPVVGALWGFFAGFALDVYAPVEWLGAHTVSMVVLGFFVGQLEERFLTLNLGMKIGVLGLGFFVCDIVYYIAVGFDRGVVFNLLLTQTLPESLYTMICGGVAFKFLFAGNLKNKHV